MTEEELSRRMAKYDANETQTAEERWLERISAGGAEFHEELQEMEAEDRRGGQMLGVILIITSMMIALVALAVAVWPA